MNLRKLNELIELKYIFCTYTSSAVVTKMLGIAYKGALKNDLTLFNDCLDIQIRGETWVTVRRNLEKMRANSHYIICLFANHQEKLMNEVNKRIYRDLNLFELMEKVMNVDTDSIDFTKLDASCYQKCFYIQVLLEQKYFRGNWVPPYDLGREE
jgi:hypothetical protein|nr:MAG TPA: hypothetical protein [Caudoviricetes sp.]